MLTPEKERIRIVLEETIRKAKNNSVSLLYSSHLNLKSCRIVGFTDASFGNLPDAASQGAFIVFLVDQNGYYSPISWQSRRIRRVANSSLAAECIAAVEVAEMCIYLKALITDFSFVSDYVILIRVLTDSKSFVENVQSCTPVKNKRLQIEMAVIREMIKNGDVSEIRWIPDRLNLANPLTKEGASCAYLLRG
jgi:hypothetical protein